MPLGLAVDRKVPYKIYNLLTGNLAAIGMEEAAPCTKYPGQSTL